MIYRSKSIQKTMVIDPIIGSEKDLRTYSIDEEKNVVRLEALGGNLNNLKTEYEIMYENESFAPSSFVTTTSTGHSNFFNVLDYEVYSIIPQGYY